MVNFEMEEDKEGNAIWEDFGISLTHILKLTCGTEINEVHKFR